MGFLAPSTSFGEQKRPKPSRKDPIPRLASPRDAVPGPLRLCRFHDFDAFLLRSPARAPGLGAALRSWGSVNSSPATAGRLDEREPAEASSPLTAGRPSTATSMHHAERPRTPLVAPGHVGNQRSAIPSCPRSNTKAATPCSRCFVPIRDGAQGLGACFMSLQGRCRAAVALAGLLPRASPGLPASPARPGARRWFPSSRPKRRPLTQVAPRSLDVRLDSPLRIRIDFPLEIPVSVGVLGMTRRAPGQSADRREHQQIGRAHV